MKVLHISTAKTWRGGEQQIAYLFSASRHLGIENILFCPRASALLQHAVDNHYHHYTFVKFNLNPFAAFRLYRLTKKLRIDLIHIHDAHAHNLVFLAYLLGGLKTSCVLHRRVDFPIQSHWLSSWKYNLPIIKKIICVSEFVQNMVARSVIHTEKLCTIYSGIDTSGIIPTPGKQNLHQLFHLPAHYKIIANVAAIAPHKDYYTWVNTVYLLKDIPDLHFIIFGDPGRAWPDLKAYIQAKGLERIISLAGFRNDLEHYFSEISVLLVSSKEEGLNTSILDAFVKGVPVVSTNAGGIPEIVLHRHTGWLGKVGDPQSLSEGVKFILERPAEIETWKANAKKFAGTKNYVDMTRQVAEVYHSVLAAK